MRRAGLRIEGVVAMDTAVGITNQAASFAIDREIVKVEKVSAAHAGRALQTNGALLDGIVWGCVDGDPAGAAIIGSGDVEVPNVLTVQSGAVWVTVTGRGETRASSEEGKCRAVIIPRDNHRKHRVLNSEGSAHIGIADISGASVAGTSYMGMTV